MGWQHLTPKQTGSSPRGRGTRNQGTGRTFPAVHPRAGGEHLVHHSSPCLWNGSSPRGRGTHRLSDGRTHPFRFIPARAGNTSRIMRDGTVSAVHPRAGGEHRGGGEMKNFRDGSSPRGRGTPDVDVRQSTLIRFIPARAGNTVGWPSGRPPRPVHPRAGGEHAEIWDGDVPSYGSSPRGRGTLYLRLLCVAAHRFIPARAGNTPLEYRELGAVPVHPRAGGEHGDAINDARAGNTARRSLSARATPVHPRAGGEHPSALGGRLPTNGSSPRGRGTHRSRGWH